MLRIHKVIILVLFFVGTLFGKDDTSTGVTLKVGTLGTGADLTVRVFDSLNLRLGASYTPLSYGFTYKDNESNIDMEADVTLNAFSILADFHPFGADNGFRISAGPVINENDFGASLDAGSIKIHSEVFDISSGEASVDFDKLCWYFGLGYGNAIGSDGNWHFSLDLGVMYQGEPRAHAAAVAVDSNSQQVLDRALESEIKHFEDDYSWLVVYPVISVGISYKF